jgi:LysM repeat protein
MTAAQIAVVNTAQPPSLPEASPTALMYTVREGDTLLGIALNFGVELSALQDANGSIDPLALPIGEQLTIPDPRNDAEGRPILPTATPLALALDVPECYETPAGGIMCLGSIENTSDQAVERVTVFVQLLRPNGMVLAEQTTSLEQTIVPAGETAPYRALFDAEWEHFARAAVLLRSADTARQVEERFVALSIEGEGAEIVNGRYVVTATLRNPGPNNAVSPRVIATLYDVDGNISGYRVFEADAGLLAGESLAVRVEVTPNLLAASLDENGPLTAELLATMLDAEAGLRHTLYAEARIDSPAPPTETTN